MNILDYLATNFDTFEQRPFGVLDSGVLSQLCMVEMGGLVPELSASALSGEDGSEASGNSPQPVPTPRSSSDAPGSSTAPTAQPARLADLLRAERYATMFTGLVPESIKECLLAAAASPRFRTLELLDYASIFDTQASEQFAAVTFVCPGRFVYVGFRGTDKSLTGWREDFDLTWKPRVPSQEHARLYLQAAAARTSLPLYVGGHSKGANLAEYAALAASPQTQARLLRVFVHDGPGFQAGTFSAADYAALDGRMEKTVPQDDVVGMMLTSGLDPQPVVSSDKGINQHSLFTWQLDGNGFQAADGLTDAARTISSATDDWLGRFTPAEVRTVVDALFNVIQAVGAQDALDLLSGGSRALELLTAAATRAQGADRDVLIRATKAFAEAFAASIAKGVTGE